MFRKVAAVFLAVLLLAGGIAASPVAAQNGSTVFDYAKAMTFRLVSDVVTDPTTGQKGRYLCTGFYVSKFPSSTVIGTAGHCAATNTNIALIGGKAYRVTWISFSYDYGYDAAVGVTSGPAPEGFTDILNGGPEPSPLAINDTIIEVGYGWGNLQNYIGTFQGIAEDFYSGFSGQIWGVVSLDKPVKGGMSGSPVFNKQAQFVGIQVYSLEGSPDANLYGGITMYDKVLEVWQGKHKNTGDGPSLGQLRKRLFVESR